MTFIKTSAKKIAPNAGKLNMARIQPTDYIHHKQNDYGTHTKNYLKNAYTEN